MLFRSALAKREALGKTVAVVGISASIALSVTGCVNPFPQPTGGEPMGDVMPPETEDQTACDRRASIFAGNVLTRTRPRKRGARRSIAKYITSSVKRRIGSDTHTSLPNVLCRR